jgi:hypothetical protein
MQVDLRQLAEIEVLTPQAERVRLGNLFEAGPSVLIWLRHFGCSFCLEQVKVLISARGQIEETGVRLVFIGQGSPEQALCFQQLKAQGVQVVTDPERVSYRALGAHRSFWGLFNLRDIGAWRRGRRLGIRTEGLQGDALQLGAALVVAPPDRILLLHINSSLSDRPQVRELVTALQAAARMPVPAQGVPA